MILERFPGVVEMSDEDKLRLMAELWNDVTNGDLPQDANALKDWVQNRWEDYQSNPDQVSSWSEVKERLLAQRR